MTLEEYDKYEMSDFRIIYKSESCILNYFIFVLDKHIYKTLPI